MFFVRNTGLVKGLAVRKDLVPEVSSKLKKNIWVDRNMERYVLCTPDVGPSFVDCDIGMD